MLISPCYLIPVTQQSMTDEWVLTSGSASVNSYLEGQLRPLLHFSGNSCNKTLALGVVAALSYMNYLWGCVL